jgi:hypothetical protein
VSDSRLPKPRSGPFHAVLEEVEPGLFRASYRGELNSEDQEQEQFTDQHVGTDAQGVRMWVEEMAKSLGYDRVVWERGPGGNDAG